MRQPLTVGALAFGLIHTFLVVTGVTSGLWHQAFLVVGGALSLSIGGAAALALK